MPMLRRKKAFLAKEGGKKEKMPSISVSTPD
jgi:hypothetical protein